MRFSNWNYISIVVVSCLDQNVFLKHKRFIKCQYLLLRTVIKCQYLPLRTAHVPGPTFSSLKHPIWQAHRETDRFLAASGVQLAQSTFHHRGEAFSSQLKSRVGNIIFKAAALRINLNVDGAPIASRSHSPFTLKPLAS
jgi:hypothetical protein